MKYDAKVSRILIYCYKKTAFFSFLKMEKYDVGRSRFSFDETQYGIDMFGRLE